MDFEKYIYIGVALILLCVIILVIQVIYVRMALSKYTRDDYYKQSLVKDTYEEYHRICSNVGVYAWNIDIALARNLNTSIMQNFAFPAFSIEHIYTLPNGTSVTYPAKEFTVIPLHLNNATSRFVNDIAAGKIEYVTWGVYMYRVVHLTQYVDTMQEFWTSEERYDIINSVAEREFIGLYTIPTIEQLAKHEICVIDSDAECKKQLDAMRLSSSSPVIQGILASSTNRSSLDINILSSMIHVLAYRV